MVASLLLLAACGSSSDQTSQGGASPATTISEGSRLPVVSEQNLLILGSTEQEVSAAIEPWDGEIVDGRDGGFHQVRFEVASLDELAEIEAALEGAGFNVQLDYADDQPGEG